MMLSQKSRYKRPQKGFRKSVSSSSHGPLVVAVAVFAAIAVGITLFVVFALPPLLIRLGLRKDPNEVVQVTPYVPPVSTPNPVKVANVSELQKEVILEQQYIADPFFIDGTVMYSGGRDSGGNPKMNWIYSFDIAKSKAERLEDIKLIYDDIFQVQKNNRFLLWVDNKRTGGGEIKAMAASGEPFTVKKYYTGMPRVTLVDGVAVWIERTGSRMDKLFISDLATGENATLAMFDNSQYGQSAASAAGGVVVWADADPAGAGGETSAIYSLNIDGKGGQPAVYQPGVYVHDPITNGVMLAWIDSNHAPDAKLYVSRFSGEPEMVDEGVLNYALGSDFIVYSKDQAIHIYLWEIDYKQVITPAAERAQLIGVQNDIVSWYQLGQDRDILKYAPIG